MRVRLIALLGAFIVTSVSLPCVYGQTERSPIQVCNNALIDSCTDTPNATAVFGRSTDAGYGVIGSGEVGVQGQSQSATGVGGLFRNDAGGEIIRGIGDNREAFHIDVAGNVYFGARARHMLYGWQTADGKTLNYGIGVQWNALYQRTFDSFFWYQKGTHSDGWGDAGDGGTRLMALTGSGDLSVSHGVQTPVLTITGGADIAEPFQLSQDEIPPGAVVVIDENNPGLLKISSTAYDTRVAGVVSGANGISPGISLSQRGALAQRAQRHVALTGRVYVLSDASKSPIRPGDLLTTSDKAGYAMKSLDSDRARGAVLGKAMSGLSEGTGMVLVLVTLQ